MNRLLPYPITIYPDIKYVDSNDISKDEKLKSVEFFSQDDEYKVSFRRVSDVFSKFKLRFTSGRRFGVYVYKNNDLIGILSLHEILDHPDGYGENDFRYYKLIFPSYRRTKYSRYASSDLLHIVFKSGIANRLYSYMPAIESGSKFFMDRIDIHNAPCAVMRFESDGVDVQKYINIKKVIDTKSGKVMLVEFDGNIYRKLDLKEYMFKALPTRPEKVINRWIAEMDEASRKVREHWTH